MAHERERKRTPELLGMNTKGNTNGKPKNVLTGKRTERNGTNERTNNKNWKMMMTLLVDNQAERDKRDQAKLIFSLFFDENRGHGGRTTLQDACKEQNAKEQGTHRRDRIERTNGTNKARQKKQPNEHT